MTIAQAINDIAAAQGGTPARPATIAGAIDALNDALAGSDQQAARTIEDAVVLLGEHIGGGGGADLGELYELLNWFEELPTVGDAWHYDYLSPIMLSSIGAGSSPLFDISPEGGSFIEISNIAEGANVKTLWFNPDDLAEYDGIYTVTIKTDGRDSTVGAVVDLNVTATTETETVEGDTMTRYAFTVPPKPVAADIPLEEGESIQDVLNIIHMIPQSGGE